MTFFEIKKLVQNRLFENGIDSAQSQAEILVTSLANLDKAHFLMRAGENISAELEQKIKDALERIISGEPIQYILGEWDFCGLPMLCGKGCLIPRWETEMLVEVAKKLIPKNGKFLDLCTGSGCIATAICKGREDVSGVGVDISAEALEYAEKNAKRHDVEKRLEFVKSDLADYECYADFDVIVSNPPYVKTADVEFFDKTMLHEPRIAFDGGEDGLDIYKAILKKYVPTMKKGSYLIFEAGHDTTLPLAQLMKEAELDVKTLNDANGIPRMCIATKLKSMQTERSAISAL